MTSHVYAQKAAEAGRCAAEQGKLWEMHDLLFANQNTLAPNDLVTHAQNLGLDVARFQGCLDSGKYSAPIMQDKLSANQFGISSVPAFLIGVTDATGKNMTVKQVIVGSRGYDQFKTTLDGLLASP